MNVLTILDHRGDTTLTWDHTNPREQEEARATVADLKSKGYSFFLVDGTPADPVGAGKGTLLVRRLTADEVLAPPEPDPEKQAEVPARDLNRRRKAVVATRPISGG